MNLDLAFKAHRRYMKKPKNFFQEEINHRQVGGSGKIGSPHRSTNCSPLDGSPSAHRDLTAAQHNYAERVKRIKRQTEEMESLGLISGREGDNLGKRDLDMSPRPTRVNAVDFWGQKTKLKLIQQLGYTEAYRDFTVKKSLHLTELSSLHHSGSSSPQHQVSASLLRNSCSPSPLDQQFPLLKLRQVPSTYNVNALVQEAKRMDVLEKIIEDCDQLMFGRVQRKRIPSPDD